MTIRKRRLDLHDLDPVIVEHFWAGVKIGTFWECWPWTRSMQRKDPDGYGQFFLGTAPSVAYCLGTGDVLEENEVPRHRCDWKPCCNPIHLVKGTQSDNAYDALERRGSYHARGEAASGAKLTEADVREILAVPRTRDTCRLLAEAYGVSTRAIYRILNRQTWRHLDEHELEGAGRMP